MSSSGGQGAGLLAGAAVAVLAMLASQMRRGQTPNGEPPSIPEELPPAPVHSEEQEQVSELEQVQVWPESLTAALLNVFSQNNGFGFVFKTLDSAALVLRLARALDSKLQTSVLDPFYAKLALIERAGMKGWQDFNGTKVLVIEGLAGSGKSTLIQGLLGKRGGSPNQAPVATFTEEPEVLQAKHAFSRMPEPVVKAFEYASNYFTAFSIRQCEHKVAIVERFYHAICAHTLCDEALGDLDSMPSSAFAWPIDLPVPDLVVYLAVSTEQRMRRRKIGGGTSATDRSIQRSLARDRKVERAYGLIRGPVCVCVDAEGSAADTLVAATEACGEYEVAVPAASNSAHSPQRVSLGVYGAWS